MMMSFPPDNFVGKKVTVMGLGNFGGQIAVVKYLVSQGAKVTVTDIARADRLKSALEQIEGLDVTLHLGGHIDKDFSEADLVVVSPAVPKDSRYLRLAEQNGVDITSEMNMFLDKCNGKVVGITGTVGKSTTVSMIESIFSVAADEEFSMLGYGKYYVGGNIGRSLLEELGRIQSNDIVLLELSSFQLEDFPAIEYSPQIAVVTNIYPNHLDRHSTFEDYVEAKANIARYQEPGDFLIVRNDDKNVEGIVEVAPEEVLRWDFGTGKGENLRVRFCKGKDCSDGVVEYFSEKEDIWRKLLETKELKVPGEHNVYNSMAAACVGLALGISVDRIREGLLNFRGMPDRLELVGDFGGVRWYNDSKSTTSQAGIVALQAFAGEKIIAIAGGYDKETDLREFASELASRAEVTFCIGQTGKKLAEQIREAGGRSEYVETLEQAVRLAGESAGQGSVVLLSPGCASWDMFDNYHQRGEKFKEYVKKYAGKAVVSAS